MVLGAHAASMIRLALPTSVNCIDLLLAQDGLAIRQDNNAQNSSIKLTNSKKQQAAVVLSK